MPDAFNPNMSSDLAHVEALLKSLRPGATRLSRDHLLFHAGRLSASPWPRRPWFWPTATAAMTLLALSLTAVLATRPAPRVTQRVVYLPAPPIPSPPLRDEPSPLPIRSSPAAADLADRPATQPAYLVLRNQVLAHGLDALPIAPAQSTARPRTFDDRLAPSPRDRLGLRFFDLDSLTAAGERS